MGGRTAYSALSMSILMTTCRSCTPEGVVSPSFSMGLPSDSSSTKRGRSIVFTLKVVFASWTLVSPKPLRTRAQRRLAHS